MNDTRRDFLKKAALLTGAAGLTNFIPESIQKAMAINAPPGSTWLDAEHIVILMQENRSFDHCFGTLKGVRGFNDPRFITLPDGNPVWLQSNKKGETYAPFRLDIKNTNATWMDSLPHSWGNQVSARNDGKFDQWLENKRNSIPEYADMPLTLGYYTREDIPFYYALADAFTVCDQHFCSALTGTNPNRLFFWTGTVREDQHEKSRAHVWNDDMDYGTLKWAAFPERLENHGISWKCYQNEVAIDTGFEGEEDDWLSNFQDNPLEFFAQYNIHLYPAHLAAMKKKSAELPAKIDALKKQIAAFPAGDNAVKQLKQQLRDSQNDLDGANKELNTWNEGMFENLGEREKSIHHKAFVTNKKDPDHRKLETLKYADNGTERELQVPKGDVLHQFREDVNSGTLPTVSWLTAPESFSDHPSSAWFGAWYVSEVLEILTKNPDVWKKTIFILTYDENDGYFDHVPPFTAPNAHKPETGAVSKGIDTSVDFVTLEQELERNDFPEKFDKESSIGLGFRVPMVIASPWTKGGWVNSEVFDHTSTLQFLEEFLSKKTGKKVQEPNISDWRRTVCGNLTSVFRPFHGENTAQPEFVKRDPFVESIHKAKFKKTPSDFRPLTVGEIAAFNQNAKSSPYMPQQEPGIRRSCALPYELYAHAQLNSDKSALEIAFTAGNKSFGSKSSGAPFNVYAPGKYLQTKGNEQPAFESVRTWAYGLTAGDTLTANWPLNEFEDKNYHLRVYGPNGFYREFKGNAADPKVQVKLNYLPAAGPTKQRGHAELVLVNSGHQPVQITVNDNAYQTGSRKVTVPAGSKSTHVLNLDKSFGWYDFSVTVSGHSAHSQRFAGRVENGEAGFSDPFMGRVIG